MDDKHLLLTEIVVNPVCADLSLLHQLGIEKYRVLINYLSMLQFLELGILVSLPIYLMWIKCLQLEGKEGILHKEIEYFNPIRKKRENNQYQFCLDFILNYI